MAKISLIGVATILMFAGIAAGVNSNHSALEDPFEGPRVDPFSSVAWLPQFNQWRDAIEDRPPSNVTIAGVGDHLVYGRDCRGVDRAVAELFAAQPAGDSLEILEKSSRRTSHPYGDKVVVEQLTTFELDAGSAGFESGDSLSSLGERVYRIDSPVGATRMPKSLSGDLRERVIEAVEEGASRREAAERFEISPSSAVRWLQRWRDHRVCAPKPRGGSRSVLEDYAQRILALVDERPDRTLDELVAAMHKRRIPGSRSALWRFLDRHGITFKKKPAGSRAASSGRSASAAPLDSAAGLS